MKKHFIKYTFVAMSISLLGLASCSSKPNDEELKKELDKQMQANAMYSGISASVNSGIVTLTGECAGNDCATEIEKQLRQNEHLDSVNNQISMKLQETDLTLRSSVLSIVSKYQGVEADVAAGTVILRGNISKAMLQPLMTELSSLQIKKLDNQMVVK
ncbi:MAG: BON domain-containing protein [Chitinophagaceae bacterium]